MNTRIDLCDFDEAVRDYDFTRKAIRNLNKAVASSDFEDHDADTIFSHLYRGMDLIRFGDFLKRYIYDYAEIEEPFAEVGDEVYREIIQDSFRETYTPFSMTPTTKKVGAIIKSWLTQPAVKRSTVILLGFGLNMSDYTVSEFLTKVLREQDFDAYDEEEIVWQYCLSHRLGYRKAESLLKQARQLPVGTKQEQESSRKEYKETWLGGPVQADEEQLMQRLACLRRAGLEDEKRSAVYAEFMKLYEHARQTIADMYNQDQEWTEAKKEWTAQDIRSADFEKIISCGIPMTESGNLEKASSSVLKDQFEKKRLTRQRLDSLVKKQLQIERFDLLTLNFFIFAQEVEPDWPAERFSQFLDDMNAILNRCGMFGVYPVNPYETFILMCLLCDEPLYVYTDIWEMSYQEGAE